jgi:hypothetical protein
MDYDELRDELEIHAFITPAELEELVSGDCGYERGRELVNKAIGAGYTLQFTSDDDYENRSTYEVEVRDREGNIVDVASLLGSIDTWSVYC